MLRKGVVVVSPTGCSVGSRVGGHSVPALEHVANQPIAHHVIDALLRAGVEDVVLAGAIDVLAGIRASLARNLRGTTRLEYATCPDGADALAALHAAAPLVGDAACVVHAAEGLLDEPLAEHLDAVAERGLDLVLLCGHQPRLQPPLRTNGRIRGEQMASFGLSPAAGVALFGPGVFKCVPRPGGNGTASPLEVIARSLSDGGRRVQRCQVDGWHCYHGEPRDLLELNRIALETLAPAMRSTAGDGNRIEGRVQIDRSASVSRSVIIGPVVVGEGAEVTNAYIGPYTSIGARARIEGSEIERSIISPGAKVMHVGARLVSSFVGRQANVFRDFSLPRALRLQVGDGDEVALC